MDGGGGAFDGTLAGDLHGDLGDHLGGLGVFFGFFAAEDANEVGRGLNERGQRGNCEG